MEEVSYSKKGLVQEAHLIILYMQDLILGVLLGWVL